MNRRVANLHIDIPDEDFQEDTQKHSPLIRFPCSVRNLHQNNNCQETYLGNFTLGVRIKLMNVKKLEKEQSELLESLESLKEGAISALIQKDEMIQSLREKCQNCQLFGSQQAFKQLENELEKQLKRILDLEEERDWLKQRVEEDKDIYWHDLEEKDHIIAIISKQIQKIQHVIHKIEIHHKQIQQEVNYQNARKNHLISQIGKVKQALIIIENPKSPSNEEILSQQAYKLISEKATSPTSSLSTSPNYRCFTSRTIQQRKFNKILSQRIEKEREKRDLMMKRLSDYYGEKLDAIKFNLCKNRLELQYCANKQNFSQAIQEQSSHRPSSRTSSFSKFNRNRKQSMESYKSYLSSAKNISDEEERQPLSEKQKEDSIEEYPEISDQFQIKQIIKNPQTALQLQQETKHLMNPCENKKWNAGLCFMLGVITGGSIMILMNKLISN